MFGSRASAFQRTQAALVDSFAQPYQAAGQPASDSDDEDMTSLGESLTMGNTLSVPGGFCGAPSRGDFEGVEQQEDDAVQLRVCAERVRAQSMLTPDHPLARMAALGAVREAAVLSGSTECRDARGRPLLAECEAGLLHAELSWLPDVRLSEDPESKDYEGDHALACSSLQHGVASLPLSTASHDSSVLLAYVPGGRGLPECARGALCVGCSATIPVPGYRGGGYSLVQYVTPAELRAFQEEGTAPPIPGPCLLCLRFFSAQFLVKVCARGARDVVDPTRVLQRFRSAIGVPGGYRRDAVVEVVPGAWFGFVSPVVTFEPSRLRWGQKGDAWAVDQSAILFTDTKALPSSSSSLGSAQETYRWLLQFMVAEQLLADAATAAFLRADTPAAFRAAPAAAVADWVAAWHRRWLRVLTESQRHDAELELSFLHAARPPPPAAADGEDAWRLRARWMLMGFVVSVAGAQFHPARTAARAPQRQALSASRREKRRRVLVGRRYARDHTRFVQNELEKNRRLEVKHHLNFLHRQFMSLPLTLVSKDEAPTPPTPPAAPCPVPPAPPPALPRRAQRSMLHSRLTQALQEVVCALAAGGADGCPLADGSSGPAPLGRAHTAVAWDVWRARAGSDASLTAWLGAGGPWARATTPHTRSHVRALLANVCYGCPTDSSQNAYDEVVAHTFYKALPRPSQIREFNEFILTKTARVPAVRDMCLRWMRNTLCGTYRHCGVRTAPRRVQEFEALCAAPLSAHAVFVTLLRRSSVLLLLVAREHLIFSVESAPFTEQTLGELFCFRAFRRRTVATADRLRLLVNACGWDALFGRTPYVTDAWFSIALDGCQPASWFSPARALPAFPEVNERWRQVLRGQVVPPGGTPSPRQQQKLPSVEDRRRLAAFFEALHRPGRRLDLGRENRIGRGASRLGGVRFLVAASVWLQANVAWKSIPEEYDACCGLFWDLAANDAETPEAFVSRTLSWLRAEAVAPAAARAGNKAAAGQRAAKWKDLRAHSAKAATNHFAKAKKALARPAPSPSSSPSSAAAQVPLPAPLARFRHGDASNLFPSKRTKSFIRPLFDHYEGASAPADAAGTFTEAHVSAMLPQVKQQSDDLTFVAESEAQHISEFYLKVKRQTLCEKLTILMPLSTRPGVSAFVPRSVSVAALQLMRVLHARHPGLGFAETLPWMQCFRVDARAVGSLTAFCLDLGADIARDKPMHLFFAKVNEHAPLTFAVWLTFLSAYEVCSVYRVQHVAYPPHVVALQQEKRAARHLHFTVCRMCNTVHVPCKDDKSANRWVPGGCSTRNLSLSLRGPAAELRCTKAGNHRRTLDIHHDTFGESEVVECNLADAAVRTATGTYLACFAPACTNVVWIASPRGGATVALGEAPSHARGEGWFCKACLAQS